MCIQLSIMYLFATEYARRKAFRAFWYTHASYPLFFILMLAHGAGRLIAPPIMYFYCLGPIVLFTVDRLVSVSRRRIEISVTKAELLPSGE